MSAVSNARAAELAARIESKCIGVRYHPLVVNDIIVAIVVIVPSDKSTNWSCLICVLLLEKMKHAADTCNGEYVCVIISRKACT